MNFLLLLPWILAAIFAFLSWTQWYCAARKDKEEKEEEAARLTGGPNTISEHDAIRDFANKHQQQQFRREDTLCVIGRRISGVWEVTSFVTDGYRVTFGVRLGDAAQGENKRVPSTIQVQFEYPRVEYSNDSTVDGNNEHVWAYRAKLVQAKLLPKMHFAYSPRGMSLLSAAVEEMNKVTKILDTQREADAECKQKNTTNSAESRIGRSKVI